MNTLENDVMSCQNSKLLPHEYAEYRNGDES